jgi:MerR family transcriptional regulator, mercuric resistance operon regulatory protein
MSDTQLTIGRLARAAGVGVETIRHYQQQGLLPVPRAIGAFRHYPPALKDRIGFIKRAQALGFSLKEISTLLSLEHGRSRKAIRNVAANRLAEIRAKIADLRNMEQALSRLIADCEETGTAQPCPIIAALIASPAHEQSKPDAHPNL